MKITGISVYRMQMPLEGGGYVRAKGKRITVADSTDSTVVRIDTAEALRAERYTQLQLKVGCRSKTTSSAFTAAQAHRAVSTPADVLLNTTDLHN